MGGRGSGAVLVWAAVLLFAAANAVVRLLADLGAAHPIEGRNAISFCNLLFVGNLCATGTLLALYRRDWRLSTIKTLTPGDWGALTVLAVLSGALAPALFYLGLENTTVSNVVLVGRIEPPLMLLFAVLFFGKRSDRWTAIGAVVALIGVMTIFGLRAREMGLTFGKGEWQTVAAAAALAGSTVLSRRYLVRIPLGIFTVFRTGVGAVVFFFAAIILYGADHFIDVTSPFLWQSMLVYGALIVVGGQLLWFAGLKLATSAQVTVATSFSLVAGLVFAWLLLDERPDGPALIGAAIILFGIALATLGGAWRKRRADRSNVAEALDDEGQLNFRGV